MKLSGQEAHHLTAVCRLGAGVDVELFDGRGRVAAVGRGEVEVEVAETKCFAPRQEGRIIIAASVAKGDRFDWMVSKCTELGVDAIWPTLYARTVKLAAGAKVNERWGRLAIEAAKQCGRVWLPEIEGVATLGECLDRASNYGGAKLLYGSVEVGAANVLSVATGGEDVIALVGPEGGMAAEEVRTLQEAGATGVRLTDTVLRVETAGVSFAAILAAARMAERGT